MMVPIVITAIVTLLIAVPVTALIASAQCKGIEQKIGNADDKAREIIDEALKTAEAKKREGLLEVKGGIHSYQERTGSRDQGTQSRGYPYERRVQQKREHRQEDRCDREEEAYLAKREEEMRKQKEDFPIERAACPGTGKNLWFDLRPGKGIFAENC
ncbi:MAG: Rnase Y domain-containing protein [Gallintestinimicrobium sp.]